MKWFELWRLPLLMISFEKMEVAFKGEANQVILFSWETLKVEVEKIDFVWEGRDGKNHFCIIWVRSQASWREGFWIVFVSIPAQAIHNFCSFKSRKLILRNKRLVASYFQLFHDRGELNFTFSENKRMLKTVKRIFLVRSGD